MQEPSVAAPDFESIDRIVRRTGTRRVRSVAAIVAMLALSTGGGAAAAARGRPPGDAKAAAPAAAAAAAAAPTDPPPAAAAPPVAPAAPATGPAYRVASGDGGVYEHGWFDNAGSAAGATSSRIVGLAQSDDGESYWLASADGGVFSFGQAAFLGAAAGASSAPIVNIAATPSRGGYWLVARDGGVFAFGDAGFFGAGVDLGLSHGIVSLAPTPSGNGYWLVSADGGVFAFGDAGFYGSLGDGAVNARIVEIVPTASGQGYYLASADGGVFTFGDAAYYGSAVDEHPAKPIVDMALAPDHDGYWLLSGDGGVFTYGNAPFLGAPAAHRTSGTFTAIAAGRGSHEPAPPPPPAPAPEVAAAAAAPIAVAAPAPAAAPPAPAPAAAAAVPAKAEGALLDGASGWDISYPQCNGARPDGGSFVIVGVNGGREFRTNRCLADQWRWARERGAAGIYLNVNFPNSADELAAGASSDRQPNCAGDLACIAYNFGLNGIRDGLAYARSQGVSAPFVWLDVEQLNHWTQDRPLNAVVLRGAIDAATEAGMGAGIYSTPFQFRKIMGDEQPGIPVWSAGANGGAAGDYCANRGFGGGPVVLVQYLPGQFDANEACPGAGPVSRYFATR